jgi:hypothetical protein
MGRGLKYNPAFARGGKIVVRWKADPDGRVTLVKTAQDSFAGLELDGSGETLSDCLKRSMKRSSVPAPASGEETLTFLSETARAKGAVQGPSLTWHPGCSKRSEGGWHKGQRHGTWTFWYQDGGKAATGNYVKGFRQGRWRSWNPAGEPQGDGTYKDGRLVGGTASPDVLYTLFGEREKVR